MSPHMLLEILAPGTADRDRTVKKKLYHRHGVAHYWVVDPDAGSVEVWDLASRTLRNRLREGATWKILGGMSAPEGA